MSQYAKLAWELHHDRDKALSYFKQAVQATPGDRYKLLLNKSISNMKKEQK